MKDVKAELKLIEIVAAVIDDSKEPDITATSIAKKAQEKTGPRVSFATLKEIAADVLREKYESNLTDAHLRALEAYGKRKGWTD